VANVHHVISLGIGTPADIPHVVLFGLSPTGPVDLLVPTADVIVRCAAQDVTVQAWADDVTVRVPPEDGVRTT
jgi:hypothetical protein